MVGALGSNRCETCRKRKIKCDGSWPICGPCKRGNRQCPLRQSLKVIDCSEQIRRQMAKRSSPKRNRSLRKKDSTQLNGLLASATSQLAVTNELRERARAFPLQAILNLTPSERLSHAFFSCLYDQIPRYNLSIIGPFASQIPMRLGSSAALDAAAACMLASHSAIVRGAAPLSRINPKLYTNALRCVQCALDDPKEWKSSNTLCAILLLQRIEAVFGQSFGTGELVHASGLAGLWQKRGPPKLADKFDCDLLADSHMCIINQALIHRKYCFIASEDWAMRLDALDGRTQLQKLCYRLVRQMTLWPTLVHGKLALRDGNPSVNRFTLIQKAQQAKQAMDSISVDLDALIERHELVKCIPATCLSDLVSEMFEFKDPMAAVVMCYHATFSIAVNQILLSLDDTDFEKARLKYRIEFLSRRIWMLVEHGLQNKPLGLPILQSSLFMTVDLALCQAQEQIIAIMNELDSAQRSDSGCWTREKIIYRARLFRGDCAA